MILSEGWVETCERLLEQIKKLSDKKDKDRLDLVQSVRFSLYSLHRSLLGWLNWVNNPDIMATFKQEELDEMNKKITEFVESFIKYDVEVTMRGVKKTQGMAETARQREFIGRGPEDIFYV